MLHLRERRPPRLRRATEKRSALRPSSPLDKARRKPSRMKGACSAHGLLPSDLRSLGRALRRAERRGNRLTVAPLMSEARALGLDFQASLSRFRERYREFGPYPFLDSRREARLDRSCFLLFQRQSGKPRVVVAPAHRCTRRVSPDIGGASATRANGASPGGGINEVEGAEAGLSALPVGWASARNVADASASLRDSGESRSSSHISRFQISNCFICSNLWALNPLIYLLLSLPGGCANEATLAV